MRPAGIEPATLGFGGQYSIHWATGASRKFANHPIVSAYIPRGLVIITAKQPLNPSNDKSPMSEEHGSLIKSPKQLIIMVFLSFFVPLIVILLLMVFVNNGKRADSEASAEQLIKPVAQLNVQEAPAPSDAQAAK